ncbi:hypothetical protein, partial [Leptospira interrogans]
LVPKPSNVGTYCKNLTTLELLESSQIAKCNLKCRNYCILLEISKELSCKFFEVLGQAFSEMLEAVVILKFYVSSYIEKALRLK